MAEQNVLTGVHYGRALHQHPAYAQPGPRLPVAESLCARLLSLPIQPEVARGHVEGVASALARSIHP
jgi:UDP-2-acetamido-2-deoxy-ribo-hexuluronate aminotransferase